MRLAGKVAFVSGAGAGIGRAAALCFAREGARVCVAELNPEAGRATADAIARAGGEALFCETDVRSDDSVAGAFAALLARFGRVDVLFNCAGGSLPADGPVTDAPPEVWDHNYQLDVRGSARCCQHAIPSMLAHGAGSIVNSSSVVALNGSHGLHAYAAAKGAILSFTRALAGEYGPRGIRANAICPGMVMTERIRARMGSFDPRTSPPVREGSLDLRRHPFAVGEPEDIANIALFLASDESRMLNGATIPAEGGVTAY